MRIDEDHRSLIERIELFINAITLDILNYLL